MCSTGTRKEERKSYYNLTPTWPDFGLNWKNKVLLSVKAWDGSDAISTDTAETMRTMSS